MTDEQRYAELLKAVGELLQNKNTTISILDYELQEAKNKLNKAEKQLQDLVKE